DGNPQTYWSSSRPQARGQSFEITHARPRRLIAFEIVNPDHPAEVPLSFELGVARGDSELQTVLEHRVLRVYREQVYSPNTFVFRVVLENPTLADRVRITIGQPVPGKAFVIQEARVYESPLADATLVREGTK